MQEGGEVKGNMLKTLISKLFVRITYDKVTIQADLLKKNRECTAKAKIYEEKQYSYMYQ